MSAEHPSESGIGPERGVSGAVGEGAGGAADRLAGGAPEPGESAVGTYRQLFEASPVPLLLFDAESLRILGANAAARELYGYSLDEMLTLSILDIRPGSEAEALRALMSTESHGLRRQTGWRHRRRDGTLLDVAVTSHDLVLDGRRCRLVLVEDVTERLRSEAALRSSEERLRQVVGAVEDGLLIESSDGRITFANAGAEKILGVPLSEITRRTHDDAAWKVTTPDGDPLPPEDYPLARVRRTGEPVHDAIQVVELPDGRRKVLSVNAAPLLDDGEFTGTVTSFRDVTEQHRAEALLRESEERYRTILEQTADAFYISTVDGRLTAWNQAFLELFGYTEEEVARQDVRALYANPSERQEFRRRVEAAGRLRDWPVTLVRKGGAQRECLLSAALRRDDDGGIVGYAGFIRDVTEWRRRAEAVRETNEILQAVVRASPVPIIAADPEGLIHMWNPAAEHGFGWTEAERLRTPLRNVLPPGRVGAELERRILAGDAFTDIELRLPRGDGGMFVASVSAAPLHDAAGGAAGAIVVAADMTARKAAEQELITAAEQQSAVAWLGQRALEEVRIEVILSEATTLIRETLAVEYAKVLERRPDRPELLLRAGVGWAPELIGSAWVSGGPESQAGHTLATNSPVAVADLDQEERFPGSDLLRENRIRSGLTVPIRGHHGILGVLAAHSRQPRSFTEQDGAFVQAVANVVGAAMERERAERQRQRFTALLEATTDYVGIAHEDGTVVYRNAAMRRVMEIDDTDEDGSAFFGSLSEADGRWFREVVIPTALEKGSWSGETRLISRGGREIPVSQVVIAHTSPEGSTFLSTIARDIRPIRELERQLQQAQKMEAVGRLAGGVAHDFNNLLTAIMGHVDLLMQRVDEAAKEDLAEVQRAATRARDLTRQLLAFSRQQILRPRVLDLNAVVEDTSRMLRRLIGEDVELEQQLAPDLEPVRADPGQLGQVLMNLAVNARDAMPEGGRLTLQTANVDLDEEYARGRPTAEAGRFVMLAVTDTGMGIAQEIRDRVFEPFFTTKEVGKGTGLGLSTVYGIVKQSGGWIWVYSEPGLGSTFKIYLPIVNERPDAPERPAEEGADLDGDETILLVEDEPAVRALVRKVLRKSGYTVLEARSGEEALAVAADYESRIDLLLTDMVMPGIGGGELAGRLRRVRGDLPVLLTSGYAEEAARRQAGEVPRSLFLEKPFVAGSLLRIVRAALDL